MTTYRLSPTQQIEVTERTDAALTAEVTYDPGGSPPPAHFHPEQAERFEVLAGHLTVQIGTDPAREVGPGATLEVPRGTVHAMWNAGDTQVRAVWITLPPGRTEEWWEVLAGMRMVDDPLQEYRDVFRLG